MQFWTPKKFSTLIWTPKKISYSGVLIALAVVFVLVGSMMFAITAYPSFKVSFSGLPVILTGFMFGPIIGGITGFLTDILSFLYLPTFYFPGYTLTMTLAGVIPGIVYITMIKRNRQPWTHFLVTLGILGFMWLGLFTFFWFLPGDYLQQNIKLYRPVFLVIGVGGVSANIILLVLFKLFLSPGKFARFAPIILAVSVVGIFNALLLPLWDQSVLGIPYLPNLIIHYLLTLPIKMWFNVIVVFLALRVISPLVSRSQVNYW